MFVLCVLMGTVVTVRQYAGGKTNLTLRSFVRSFVRSLFFLTMPLNSAISYNNSI